MCCARPWASSSSSSSTKIKENNVKKCSNTPKLEKIVQEAVCSPTKTKRLLQESSPFWRGRCTTPSEQSGYGSPRTSHAKSSPSSNQASSWMPPRVSASSSGPIRQPATTSTSPSPSLPCIWGLQSHCGMRFWLGFWGREQRSIGLSPFRRRLKLKEILSFSTRRKRRLYSHSDFFHFSMWRKDFCRYLWWRMHM